MRFGFHPGRGHGRDCGRGPGGGWGWKRGWGPIEIEMAFEDRSGGERGGRGGRRRMFDGSELRLLLLKLIEESPRHGYDLIREIEERSGGIYAPSPGVIYPTLTMLDEMGLIEAQETEGAKKVFAITVAGQAHLTEREEEVAAILAKLETMASMRARTRGGPVRRAMGNLRAVLQHRLTEDGVEADVLHQVAAIIDEAAQKIERLK